MGNPREGARQDDSNIVTRLSRSTSAKCVQHAGSTIVTRAKGKRPLTKKSCEAVLPKKKAKTSKAAEHALPVSSVAVLQLSGAELVNCIAQATAACCSTWPSGTLSGHPCPHWKFQMKAGILINSAKQSRMKKRYPS